MQSFESLAQNVVSGSAAKVKETVNTMLAAGVSPLEIINQGLIGGMNIVGPLFKNGEMFVPEVLMSAKAMAAGIDIVKPLIADTDIPSAGKVIIGTVKGDLHDIGKNLVSMMLESAGFTVVNLGVDNSPEKFVQAIKEHHPSIMGMSENYHNAKYEIYDRAVARRGIERQGKSDHRWSACFTGIR